MENIEEKRDRIAEKRDYLKRKLKNYENLQYRSTCPCCEQPTDREFYKNKISGIKEELTDILAELDALIPAIHANWIEKRVKNYLKEKEHNAKIQEYISLNKNRMNKALRDYNKGIEKYLPSMEDSEKVIWNEAIEVHLANRDIENDELCFDLE